MNTPEPRTIFNFLLLLVAAAASIYIASSNQEPRDKSKKPELSLAYYLDNAELTGTGPDGSILYQVSTRLASQRQDDDTIEMDEVRMIYGPPTAMPWELEANAGRIPADASVIELMGDVVAISEEEGEKATIIRTQRLDIKPETREAFTDEPVELEFDGRVINATGMQANLETNELKLLADVNGKFMP